MFQTQTTLFLLHPCGRSPARQPAFLPGYHNMHCLQLSYCLCRRCFPVRRYNNLTSRDNDLTERYNNLASRDNDLTEIYNNLTEGYSDLAEGDSDLAEG